MLMSGGEGVVTVVLMSGGEGVVTVVMSGGEGVVTVVLMSDWWRGSGDCCVDVWLVEREWWLLCWCLSGGEGVVTVVLMSGGEGVVTVVLMSDWWRGSGDCCVDVWVVEREWWLWCWCLVEREWWLLCWCLTGGEGVVTIVLMSEWWRGSGDCCVDVWVVEREWWLWCWCLTGGEGVVTVVLMSGREGVVTVVLMSGREGVVTVVLMSDWWRGSGDCGVDVWLVEREWWLLWWCLVEREWWLVLMSGGEGVVTVVLLACAIFFVIAQSVCGCGSIPAQSVWRGETPQRMVQLASDRLWLVLSNPLTHSFH